MSGHVLAVVGGQYGSEGKGVIVGHLANRYNVHVRVGGPNAGHSFYHAGKVWKMQGIPVGWKNPYALLVIGRGGMVDVSLLKRELKEISASDPTIHERLKIDTRAIVLDSRHHLEEGGVNGEMHGRIGSTGEGVGAARHARMSRDPNRVDFFGDIAGKYGLKHLVAENTPAIIQDRLIAGDNILLEGTQGAGLSLIHGPWPFVTSADTNAAQLAADIGLPPRLVQKTVLVVRSHPIRVAGNSGPLKGETSWEEISERLGRPVQERTTVTKKVRRVGTWDEDLVQNAITWNAPTSIALTFADYINPRDENCSDYGDLSPDTQGFVRYLERRFAIPVSMVGTGGPEFTVIERGVAL